MASAGEKGKDRAKRLLRRLDIHLGRHRYRLAGARERLLREGGVSLVIDVGAHFGEYATELRREGYRGEIVSFEPGRSQFERLRAAAERDEGWSCQNRACGERAERSTIGISGNEGFSSSLLAMEPAHEEAAEGSGYEGEEQIEVVPLDEAIGDRDGTDRDWYLKVDTQGFEDRVIAGAAASLRNCVAVELELSLRPLYRGQALIGDVIELMRGHCFLPTHLEPEFTDPSSGELLQVNGLFQASARIPKR